MDEPEKRLRAGEKRLRAETGRKNIVGIRVRERRQELKLSPDELAAGIEEVTNAVWTAGVQEIYKIESGRRAVTDIEVIALARTLECSPCYLLTGEMGESVDKV